MEVKRIQELENYFELSARQAQQFAALPQLYKEWNEKINVISRKDIDNLMLHHVLHSLAIAQVQEFMPDMTVLDVGTGGGFPGIPLAILFPNTQFVLVDSIGKKIRVVKEISTSIGLNNIQAQACRAEDIRGSFNFVVSRAVARLSVFWPWVKNKIRPTSSAQKLSNGLLYLKGGDLTAELEEAGLKSRIYPISNFFKDSFFETKVVVHISS